MENIAILCCCAGFVGIPRFPDLHARGELADLVDILALELLEEGRDAIIITVNTDGGEDVLDVPSRGRGVSAIHEKEVGCEVLHICGCLGCFLGRMLVMLWCVSVVGGHTVEVEQEKQSV